MAKELPYFKFEPNAWENGNIQMLSREDKGLFIDICSMFWSRLGDLPEKLVIQKLCGGNASALKSLYEENIIESLDGAIYVKFLSIQLQEFENTRSQNSENAKKRWQKHHEQKDSSERNATASSSQCETDAIREEERREEKIKYRAFAHLSISVPEFNKLIDAGYSKDDIDTVLDSIENYKNKKKYTSLYLTALNWLKKNKPEVAKEIPGETMEERTRRLYVERIRNEGQKQVY